jgi:hypothetical protein
MNKKSKIFLICYPHLGVLDSWLPIVSEMSDMTDFSSFTLIIPNAMITRNFHMDNAIVNISDSIFDSVLIRTYDKVWIKHTSVLNSINWYKNNHSILRLLDMSERLINRFTSPYLLARLLSFSCKKIFRKQYKIKHEELNCTISKNDILFYDVATENNDTMTDILQLFENNNKYSLSHAINLNEFKDPFTNIKNKSNIKVYIYRKKQIEYYKKTYGIDTDRIRVVGIPRHDQKWIEKIQEENLKLPDFFNENSILILTRHVSDVHCSFDEKIESLRSIKKIFIDRMGMTVILKLHPSEKQEKIFLSKIETIYEDVFGSCNYGSTWVYSDMHALSLAKEAKLVISLNTSVIFDIIVSGKPCVEYIDSSIGLKESKKYKKKITRFVQYGFIEGVSNYQELCVYVDRWISDPCQISISSTNAYKKYFPRFDGISNKIATEILFENKIRSTSGMKRVKTKKIT